MGINKPTVLSHYKQIAFARGPGKHYGVSIYQQGQSRTVSTGNPGGGTVSESIIIHSTAPQATV